MSTGDLVARILELLREDVGGGHLRGRAFAFTPDEIAYRLSGVEPADVRTVVERMATAGVLAFSRGHYSLPAPARTGVEVVVYEDGKEVERKPLPPDEYMVLCGENKQIAHVQEYPKTGTTVVTIKRVRP